MIVRRFARLAVFAGGFSLEAAEEVCEIGLDELQSLVDKSLVRQTDRGDFSSSKRFGSSPGSRWATSTTRSPTFLDT